jgi:TolB-like protein/Tfp pilus assembly protein PilF
MRSAFRIGDALVEPDLNSISRGGRMTHVEPKAMDLLMHLAEHAGDVVSKERLIQAVWTDTFVTDYVLTRSIANLRRALDDDARKPDVIQTIPKGGYRILAAVEWIDRHEVIDSLAVLPFMNESGDPSLEYFSDGVSESIINRLSQLPQVRVIAWSTVFRYKGREQDPLNIGRELGVRALVMGRVSFVGQALMISTELVDVSRGWQIWGEQYRRTSSDILAIQDEIACEIAQRLRPKLSTEQRDRLARRSTRNTEAYGLYLRGRYLWNRRSVEGIRKAAEYFEQAIRQDPGYALAHSGLADCYAVLSCQIDYGAVPPREGYPRAEAAARKALELDPSLAEAYASLGMVHEAYTWDWLAAEEAFRRAIELNSGHATAHHWYALLLALLGREGEAFVQIEQALETDPLSLMINTDAGRIYYFSRNYDRAIQQLLKALELEPGFVQARTLLGHVYVQTGRLDQARSEFEQAMQLCSRSSIPVAVLGYTVAATQGEQRRRGMEQCRQLARERYVPASCFAACYAIAGETEQAFVWIEKALQERSSWLTYMAVDPAFDNLRSDPRFQELARRLGLPHDQHTLTYPPFSTVRTSIES